MILARFLIQHLWQSTLFAGVTAVLASALQGNHARVRHWLWLVASMRFLTPLSLLVFAGAKLGPWIGPSLPAGPALDQFAQAADTIGGSLAKPVGSAISSGAATNSAAIVWTTLILAVWLSGFAAVVFLWTRRWLSVRRVIRGASPLPMGIGVPVLSSHVSLEPGVFGIWRPVLLLPAGIADRLTPQQMRAIIAHELCHVRRHDNLASAIHMVVEAVFWFHPLVWWLGARLVEERERACDEDVLRMGNASADYAEGILNVCKFYLESPLACVSGVTGSDLRRRIERIVAHRTTLGLSLGRKLLLATAAVSAVGLPLVIGIVNVPPSRAQSIDAKTPGPAFEVASIKPSRPDDRASFIRPAPGGGITAENVTLKTLVKTAYGIQDFQLSGGPGWLDSNGYDVQAKAEAQIGFDKIRLALRKLLADRFHLAIHTETKELPVYALVVAKSGPKFQEAKRAAQDGDGGFHWGRGHTYGQMVTMAEFVEVLSGVLGRPVLDDTAIKGRFDLKLEWTPEGFVPRERPAGNNEPQIDPNGPSIFTAIQEQLGLRLESRKGPVEILVIDHAEKPSEN
jgi:bla regulator protein blaR1